MLHLHLMEMRKKRKRSNGNDLMALSLILVALASTLLIASSHICRWCCCCCLWKDIVEKRWINKNWRFCHLPEWDIMLCLTCLVLGRCTALGLLRKHMLTVLKSSTSLIHLENQPSALWDKTFSITEENLQSCHQHCRAEPSQNLSFSSADRCSS